LRARLTAATNSLMRLTARLFKTKSRSAGTTSAATTPTIAIVIVIVIVISNSMAVKLEVEARRPVTTRRRLLMVSIIDLDQESISGNPRNF